MFLLMLSSWFEPSPSTESTFDWDAMQLWNNVQEWPLYAKIGGGVGVIIITHYALKRIFRCFRSGVPKLYKKDWVKDKIYLYQFPRSGVIPSVSPYCLKLETWLRFAMMDYESYSSISKRSKEGLVPFVEVNGVQLHDSALIIQTLTSQFELFNMESDLTEEEKGISRAIEKLCENSLIPALMFNRFCDKDNCSKFLKAPIVQVSALVGFIYRRILRRRLVADMRARLRAHGLGKHSREEIYDIALRDLAALSQILGFNEYFFGKRPHLVDIIVFSVLAQIYYIPLDNPLKDAMVEDYQNLKRTPPDGTHVRSLVGRSLHCGRLIERAKVRSSLRSQAYSVSSHPQCTASIFRPNCSLRSVVATMVNPQKSKVYIIGVGMTKFVKPQSVPGLDYPDMVKEAVNKALSDAKVKYSDIQQATVGYLFGGSCCAQRALYEVGMTGIPIYNVNNACASGSSGLFMCKQFIEGGGTDLALAVGFEKMAQGSLENMGGRMDDRAMPVEKHIGVMSETYGLFPAPMTAQMFGNAGKEHMEKYGTKPEHFAKIAWKNHKHSVNNPNSQFQKEYSLEEVMKARRIYDFMGLLECSPTSDGAAAAVLCSEKFLREHPHLKDQAVEILGMQLGTDFPSAFSENSNIKMIGFDMIQNIAGKLYKETGLGPNDVQVIECHDCFAPNELITYEALGLCPI
uniref:Uncharacterized protein n=1 Tax=Plectus sambesii TaxID=2011161 RepID=A0A914XJ86_9BILA